MTNIIRYFQKLHFVARTLFLRKLLMAVVVIPIHNLDAWKFEKFNNREPNQVTASADGLSVKVKSSASPLVFLFSSKLRVLSFKIEGEFKGLPRLSDTTLQGAKGYDDYPLRIGFIVPGSKTLSGIKKIFAASWVKQLYSFIPANLGLDRVQFYNVTQNQSQLGKSRKHPSSDLLEEEFFAYVDKPGAFSYNNIFNTPIESVAIWLSIDGDDTKSEYEVLIKNLEVEGQ